jgi:hypothetical protein
MKLLVTGGCGFIGSNFVVHMLESYPDVTIINLDLLTYAGNLENLQDATAYGQRHVFVRGDIADPRLISTLLAHCGPAADFDPAGRETGCGDQFCRGIACGSLHNELFGFCSDKYSRYTSSSGCVQGTRHREIRSDIH